MNELTMVLFIATLVLFVIGMVTKKNPVNWLTFFVSVCSIGQTITDMSLENTELVLLAVPTFYIVLMSGWWAFSKSAD